MAHMSTTGFDDLAKQLDKMLKAEEIGKKAVNEAAPTIVDAVKRGISSVATKGYSTGSLVKSIEATDAKVNAYGVFAAIRPTGRDNKAVRNAEKMAYLEYGTTKKDGSTRQEARPVMAAAAAEAREKCEEKMKRVIYSEMGADT